MLYKQIDVAFSRALTILELTKHWPQGESVKHAALFDGFQRGEMSFDELLQRIEATRSPYEPSQNPPPQVWGAQTVEAANLFRWEKHQANISEAEARLQNELRESAIQSRKAMQEVWPV